MSNFNSADIAAFKDVWVFCEQREGKTCEKLVGILTAKHII